MFGFSFVRTFLAQAVQGQDAKLLFSHSTIETDA